MNLSPEKRLERFTREAAEARVAELGKAAELVAALSRDVQEEHDHPTDTSTANILWLLLGRLKAISAALEARKP